MQLRKWSVVLVLGFALSALCGGVLFADDAVPNAPLHIGIFADLHAHDTDSPNEEKVMTDYAERLSACVEAMNAWPADLVIQLGDFVNGRFVMGAPLGEPDRVGAILAHAWSILTVFDGPCYSVIGNHDVYDLTKGEFLTIIDATDTYFSFDVGAYHLVVLDAQYKRTGEDYGRVVWMVQGTIPKPQLAWLEEDLASTTKPTIVCVHQPLDVDFSLTAGGPPVFNHKEVQSIIAQSGVVIAVFQGHDHENNYTLINGVHYLTFEALVNEEGRVPSWAYVTLDPVARTITITGEGEQADWELPY